MDVGKALERVPWWKLLGVAGLAGVAATGLVVTRNERARRSMTPDEIRSRLHQRYAEVEQTQNASS